jgi:dockerin type I repeat protein
MMSSEPNHPDDDLPQTLVTELRRLYEVPAVPSAVDTAILADARAGFARRRRFALARRVAVVAIGTAATAALAVVALRPALTDVQPQSGTGVQHLSIVEASAEDVDHSGKVDILDAFVVAKLIEVDSQINEAYDVNGDGRVDQGDVDRIASVAVAVDATHPNDARVQ